jgi:hypothetical protein
MSREADWAIYMKMNANGVETRIGRRTERTLSQTVFLSEAKRELNRQKKKGSK